MKTLLISPSKMSLSDNETVVYQNALKQAELLSLNLMAVKVESEPSDFNAWCVEMIDICVNRVNRDLLEDDQVKPLKKLTDLLMSGISINQLRLAKVAPWPFYAKFMQKHATVNAFDERRRLLEYVANIKADGLKSLISEDRMAVAGKHTANHDPSIFNFDVEWFGSTKTAKVFHQLLDDNAQLFDTALAEIPLEGAVDKAHYDAFIALYVDVFKSIEEKALLGPATRLLAMRRPDQFVVVTSAKLDAYCQGLGLKRISNTDFAGYWKELITSIRQTSWWNSELPEIEEEQFFWHNRAILIDMLLYADETTALKSKYLKALSRPAKSRSTGGGKRSKESASALVDRVLASDEVPSFIAEHSNSNVAQVEAGKKIDDVISLLHKIFG
ncbi:MAG: hypothetical protein HRU25_04095 [Psychrobium sp.]|nr:hypothetical protein [Psychrobium sp.]